MSLSGCHHYAAKSAGPLAGKMMSNCAPPSRPDDASSCPPWRSTIIRQMAKPNPIPRALVVTNASNMLSNFFRIDSRSCIHHLDDNSIALVAFGLQAQHTVSIFAVHRLDRIKDQVEKDLLQLTPVAHDTWRFRHELGACRNVVFCQLPLHDVQYAQNYLVYINLHSSLIGARNRSRMLSNISLAR